MEAPLSRPFVHRRKIGASPMSTLESVYTCRKRNTVRSQSGQRRGAPANQYLHEVVEEARRPLQGSSSSLEVGWFRKPERGEQKLTKSAMSVAIMVQVKMWSQNCDLQHRFGPIILLSIHNDGCGRHELPSDF